MFLIWSKFLILLALVYIFGAQLTRSADIIAEKKKFARAFMGVVFISMITSFPELFTGISAAAIVKSADMAIGEIIGSCVFNLFIIAIIDGFFRKKNLYLNHRKGDLLPLGFSFLMIGLFTLSLSINLDFQVLNLGISSLLIMVFYLIFLWIMFKERKVTVEKEIYREKNLRKEMTKFVVSGLFIIAIGFYLPVVGKELAVAMDWQESFVGVIFLALVTSFPELVVSISTARIGAFDMFIGNIAGSNLFNIAIVFFIDMFYLKGNILQDVSGVNVSCGIIAMIMNFVVFFALVRQSRYRVFNFISINAILLFLLYVVNILILL
jgi:cation:H+ antiporter